MTPTRWIFAILGAVLVAGFTLLHLGVSILTLTNVVVYTSAPAATLFVALYATTVRWWEFWIGRALFVSSLGLAGLLDLSALLRWLGPNYPFRDEIVFTIVTLAGAGAMLKLIALLVDKVPLWLRRRERRAVGEDHR